MITLFGSSSTILKVFKPLGGGIILETELLLNSNSL